MAAAPFAAPASTQTREWRSTWLAFSRTGARRSRSTFCSPRPHASLLVRRRPRRRRSFPTSVVTKSTFSSILYKILEKEIRQENSRRRRDRRKARLPRRARPDEQDRGVPLLHFIPVPATRSIRALGLARVSRNLEKNLPAAPQAPKFLEICHSPLHFALASQAHPVHVHKHGIRCIW